APATPRNAVACRRNCRRQATDVKIRHFALHHVHQSTANEAAMTSRLASALALVFLLTSSEIAAAQDLASQLVGVWKRTSAARKSIESGSMAQPRDLGGVAVFTPGGRFVFTQHAAERKGPAGAAFSDAEWAALARSSFFGSGTYKVEGDVV